LLKFLIIISFQVLLFYPDGKRSSSAEGHIDAGGQPAAVPGNAGGVVIDLAVGEGHALPGAVVPNAPAAPPALHAVGHGQQQLAAAPRVVAQRRDTTVSSAYCKTCKKLFCSPQPSNDCNSDEGCAAYVEF
jgi:hypothetical protein